MSTGPRLSSVFTIEIKGSDSLIALPMHDNFQLYWVMGSERFKALLVYQ